MKIKTNYFIILLAVAISTLSVSCKKDVPGCTDPTSSTYNSEANVDDGSCQYPGCTDSNSLNYDAKATMDDGSCTYARDAFIGTFSATETCTNGSNSVTASWNMTISAGTSTDVSEVLINNLGDYGVNGTGTVDGTTLTFDLSGAVNIVGSGTLSGNKLDFTYTASTGSASETCTGTATKN